MYGSVTVTGEVADRLDVIMKEFLQANVLRGSVTITMVNRDTYQNTKGQSHPPRPRYQIQFEGTLEALAGEEH